jgi:S-adenosylmethionine:tRNA ribosyltransferase-isomerase
MRLKDFDFELPEELIALRPARPRPASRLLVAQGGRIADSTVSRLGGWLRPGDLLVLNDARVIPARLRGSRARLGGGVASIEVTLISLGMNGQWRALARPGKRLAPGDAITFGSDLQAVVRDRQGGEIILDFNKSGQALEAALEVEGMMPLPPYIARRRPVDARDREDYQTVFATRPGAVAAPTASLHFDADLLAGLSDLGISTTKVTLHVGAGTFLPVRVENIDEHKMHAEWGEISPQAAGTIRDTIRAGGRIIPVGTTALRLLESAATGKKSIAPWSAETSIFIRPGYEFKIADGLMTNFHLPESTLMMLVSALMVLGRLRAISPHAFAGRYRFFSYGDSSLLLPQY